MLVESTLKKSVHVSECTVVGRKRKNSDYYESVAYVVKKDSTQQNACVVEELNTICSINIPTYMIPAEYRFVKELPHTPVGKIDFRVLEREAQKEIKN